MDCRAGRHCEERNDAAVAMTNPWVHGQYEVSVGRNRQLAMTNPWIHGQYEVSVDRNRQLAMTNPAAMPHHYRPDEPDLCPIP